MNKQIEFGERKIRGNLIRLKELTFFKNVCSTISH